MPQDTESDASGQGATRNPESAISKAGLAPPNQAPAPRCHRFTLVGYPYGRKVLIFRDQFLRVMNLVVRKVCDEIDSRFLERFMHDNRVSLHGFSIGG
jgi:hypothetical protein